VRVAVIGKGGSGKTAIAGVNPSLGISLGAGLEATDALAGIRQSLDDGGVERAPGVEALLERFGVVGPDGVRLAVVSKIDQPNPGCP
jgi:CO dehydrogenase maturation factor